MVPFPQKAPRDSSSCQKPEGISLWYLQGESVRVPGWISHSTVGLPQWVGPLGAFVSEYLPEPPAIHPSSFRSPYQAVVPAAAGTPCTFLSLQSWSLRFSLCCLLPYGSKKSCSFFSLLSFLLVRMEWHLLSSSHARPEASLMCWNWQQFILAQVLGKGLPSSFKGLSQYH